MSITTYPLDYEAFELTLGSLSENDPIEMVRRNGYRLPEKWLYKGRRIGGLETRTFELVPAGFCRTFDELTQEIVKCGTIPEGQWREALNAAYKPDGLRRIGVADLSWMGPSGHMYFPCITSDGDLRFCWTVYPFDNDWRWLVEVDAYNRAG